jgi:uncharacterized membrane protein
MIKIKSSRNWQLPAVVVFFAIIYSLITVVNHYNFRTYALDMGVYTNALYDYARLQWNDSTIWKPVAENVLSDHFDLTLFFIAPLSFLLGSYTLPLVQIFFVLLGGIGVYRYFKLNPKQESIAIYATIAFYLFFGIFAALAFDYHGNVVSMALVPWFFVQLRRNKLVLSFLFLLAILFGKENMSLWMAFVSLGLLANHWRQPRVRYFLIFAFLFSLVYFFLVLQVFMPALSNEGNYTHFNYDAVGATPGEAISTILRHPIEVIKIMFTNHTGDPMGDYVKLELWLFLTACGLPLLLLRPQYLVMLAPIFFQKLLSNISGHWGVGYQYSVEFAPIMAIGVFSVVALIPNKYFKHAAAVVLVLLSLGTTIRLMDNTHQYINKTNVRIYARDHYVRQHSVKHLHQVLKLVPDGVVVSAQTAFVPHLALRDTIYQFPIIKDATYVVVSNRENTWPMVFDDFSKLTTELETNGEWEVVFKDGDIMILKRKPTVSDQ